MKNIITAISAWTECTWKNIFTRIGIFLLIPGLILFYFHPFTLIPDELCIFGSLPFWLTRCGLNSYQMYARSYQHMVKYQRDVESMTYCGTIGCNVARRRFKKAYPERYEAMISGVPIPFAMLEFFNHMDKHFTQQD
jgi:hypothetical protein